MTITTCPTPARLLWLYLRSADARWRVGYFDPAGCWWEDSSHAAAQAAADRVHWLNGGHPGSEHGELLVRAEFEIIRLDQLLERLDAAARKWESVARRKARHSREMQRRRFRR